MFDILNPDEVKPTPEELLAYYYRRGQEEKANPRATFISMNEQDFRMILEVLGKGHNEIMDLGERVDKKIIRIEGADPEWVRAK